MENTEMTEEYKSYLPFTDEELKQLNFTPEELEILESASAYSETVDMLPEDPDDLIEKVEANFSDNMTADEVFEKLGALCESDPDFIAQLIASQELLTDCKPYSEDEEQD